MRIGVLTSGGDCPGLNAVIRSVVHRAVADHGDDVVGFHDGWKGLLECDYRKLDLDAVSGILARGGTILGSSRVQPAHLRDGVERARGHVADLGLDAIIPIGGEGTLKAARMLSDAGLPIVGVPKTIDNDLSGTVITFGFDTAVTVATEAIDRLHSTAEAHERVFVVEVMGRYAGWIALHSGVSATADVVLIPEIPYDIASVCDKIMDREAHGRRFSIVVVSEGARPVGGEMVTRDQGVGRERLLGGIGVRLAEEIAVRTGKETRTVVLGHLQRGGGPTTFDRLLALRFGAAAVRMVAERRFDVMVALDPPTVLAVPLEVATERMKCVPLDCDTMLTARDLGICFGDGDGEK
jgi:phosphofructokinase-like protein